MRCPLCGYLTGCLDSRPQLTDVPEGYDITRRRRQCKRCGHRFSTYELSADLYEQLRVKAGIADANGIDVIMEKQEKARAMLRRAHDLLESQGGGARHDTAGERHRAQAAPDGRGPRR